MARNFSVNAFRGTLKHRPHNYEQIIHTLDSTDWQSFIITVIVMSE